jgi:hypothetical protein
VLYVRTGERGRRRKNACVKNVERGEEAFNIQLIVALLIAEYLVVTVVFESQSLSQNSNHRTKSSQIHPKKIKICKYGLTIATASTCCFGCQDRDRTG